MAKTDSSLLFAPGTEFMEPPIEILGKKEVSPSPDEILQCSATYACKGIIVTYSI